MRGGSYDKYPAVPVWQDVMHDHPAHMLASYSARADLVVIGRHDASGSHSVIAGIQHALLNHGRGPIAIVPATGASGVYGSRTNRVPLVPAWLILSSGRQGR